MSNNNPFENLHIPDFSAMGNALSESTRKYQEMMLPITEALQKYTEMMRPIKEAAESFSARFGDIAAKAAEATRPFLAIGKFKEAQYVYWDFIPKDFMEEVIASENVNKTLRVYESKNKYQKSEAVITECLQHPYILPQGRMFEQVISAYHNGQYDLAAIGLIAMIDSVLSEASRNLTHKPFDRCNAIFDKIAHKNTLDSDEYAIMSLGLTYQAMVDTLYKTVPFSEKEPKNLNRHWIMHGRSKRKKTQLDCIKMINFLYGIILIDELSGTGGCVV